MESKTKNTYLKNKLPLWRNNKNINKTKTATNIQPQRKPTKLKISKVKMDTQKNGKKLHEFCNLSPQNWQTYPSRPRCTC